MSLQQESRSVAGMDELLHHHHADASDDAFDDDWSAMADLLDLDGEVLHAYLADASAWVHQVAAGRPVRRILDVGSGTGNGALALAGRFGDAEVIAVDESGDLLARLRAKARERGLDGRVQTVEADLNQAWPALGPVDLTWTSMALHHLADPDRGLREIFAATRPGGLLAVAEMTGPQRFLPDDIGMGRPGLEARAQAAVAERHSGTMPYLGADWGPLLTRAGFTGVDERVFGIELSAPLPQAAGRFAQAYLRRVRTHLDGALAADDLAVLDVLIAGDGPGSVVRRQDLAIRATRTLWTATRP
jgi:SAM-dependent methyltransferase